MATLVRAALVAPAVTAALGVATVVSSVWLSQSAAPVVMAVMLEPVGTAEAVAH